MAHHIAERNIRANIVRPMAVRLAHVIDLLSREWADAILVAEVTKECRLAITKSYLVNALGLKMFIETRVTDGIVEMQIHHLPRQEPAVVEEAIAMLSEHELDNGVADALRSLCRAHPFAGGDFPAKPGYTLAEAHAAGFTRAKRGEEGESLELAALKWISECWVTNREWTERYASTRISQYISILGKRGYDISVEYRTSDADSIQNYASYRYFVDPVERAAWNAEQQWKLELSDAEEAARVLAKAQDRADKTERRITATAAVDAARVERRAAAADAKQAKIDAKAAAKLAKAKPSISIAPMVEAPMAVPAVTSPDRLIDSLSRREYCVEPAHPRSAPIVLLPVLRAQPTTYGTPKREIQSSRGIPAVDLNRIFPRAGSKAIVTHGGAQFIRRFRPVKQGGTVQAWETFWENASSAAGPVIPPPAPISAHDIPY